MQLTTDIIPSRQQFLGKPQTLDYEAICVFCAIGFFLDQDTYYKEQKVLKPARHYTIDSVSQKVTSEKQYFKWHYKPQDRSFNKVVTEFGDLFESIIKEQTVGKNVILPLSGGLDSRTQAVALQRLGIPTQAYSYKFDGGHDETWYGKSIAQTCDFPFQSLTVNKGYLWNIIESLAVINGCYSEFTHPRQMAFSKHFASYGDVFSLGHWGDVLFDDMKVADNLSTDEQVEVLMKKIVKKRGLNLAERLWKSWNLSGDFHIYLKQRIYNLLVAINIPENANAQIRAFKSLYWAPRWTSVNLSVFEAERPITLPYYDNRMCNFICSIPEKYLANRQIQIAYIKQRMPELAKLTWEAQRPFNLYSYSNNKLPWNLPYRIINKLKRTFVSKQHIQRNWELQFLGTTNDKMLKQWLFDNSSLDSFVSMDIRKEFYKLFKEDDAIFYAHALSMLLTLSLFSKRI